VNRRWPLIAMSLLLSSSTLAIAQGTATPTQAPAGESPTVTRYRIAAEQGNAHARFKLGEAYYDGQGVAQDRQQALQWFRAAAEQGHVEAQYTLGFIYHMGRGVSSDPSQAIAWYQKAAAQGHARAASSLKQLQGGATKSSAPPPRPKQSEGFDGKESTPEQKQTRMKLLASIPDSETIVFHPKGKSIGVFTIFVDPDCLICAQLFADTAQITAEDIKVRYVLTMDSDISRRIWCSADRAAALKAAFQTGDRARTSLPKCATSFTTRFGKTSQSFGVSATPTTFTDRGRVLVGYISIPSMLYTIDETHISLVEEVRKLE
jgi:hypothetical protein